MSAAKKIDRKALMRDSLSLEQKSVADRFAKADEVLLQRPSGLALPERGPVVSEHSLSAAASSDRGYLIGRTYELPLAKFRESPMNARVFYSAEDVDGMATSLIQNRQEVPVTGYANTDGDSVMLVDGQKRLRGARAGGLEVLRVEICAAPADEKSVFLMSRRINRDRSSQTALDDAVRFQQLLDGGHFSNQEELGKAVEMSQSSISRVLAINKIPERIMHRMKDSVLLTGVAPAHALSQIFAAKKFESLPDEAEDLATSIIEEILKSEMSGRQVQTLVASRLAEPRKRVRNESRHINFGGVQGVIKTNAEKGWFDFSIKGLTADLIDELREKIETFCAGNAKGADASRG